MPSCECAINHLCDDNFKADPDIAGLGVRFYSHINQRLFKADESLGPASIPFRRVVFLSPHHSCILAWSDSN